MSGNHIGVFLDRDGTLNEEVEFLANPADVKLIPGAGAAVRTLNRHGLVTCVISNQSGIARGFLTEEDLVPIHARLVAELQRDGALLDRIYYCPHHPTEGKEPYVQACSCRKPEPGMLRLGEREFGLDLGKSFVVGDRMVDIKAGRAVGAATVLVLTGYGREAAEESRTMNITPAFVAATIVEAVDYITEQLK